MVGNEIVAVKRLSRNMHESKFHKEVECLMKAKHKNIMRFLGYCSDTQGRAANCEVKFVMAALRNWWLCFEYVANGSLDKYVSGNDRNVYSYIYFLSKCDYSPRVQRKAIHLFEMRNFKVLLNYF